MRFLLFISLLPLLVHCGYRMGYVDRALPGGYSQVAIPVFTNETKEVGLEGYFSNALRREFFRSQVAGVAAKSNAPVTLEGTIKAVKYEPIGQLVGNRLDANMALDAKTFNKNLGDNPARLPPNTVLASQYRIVVTARILLRRNSDKKILWQGHFRDEKVYSAPQVGLAIVNSVNPLYNHSDRHRNIRLIAKDMMSEAHDRITENF